VRSGVAAAVAALDRLGSAGRPIELETVNQ
jgi:hypothetical protein